MLDRKVAMRAHLSLLISMVVLRKIMDQQEEKWLYDRPSFWNPDLNVKYMILRTTVIFYLRKKNVLTPEKRSILFQKIYPLYRHRFCGLWSRPLWVTEILQLNGNYVLTVSTGVG